MRCLVSSLPPATAGCELVLVFALALALGQSKLPNPRLRPPSVGCFLSPSLSSFARPAGVRRHAHKQHQRHTRASCRHDLERIEHTDIDWFLLEQWECGPLPGMRADGSVHWKGKHILVAPCACDYLRHRGVILLEGWRDRPVNELFFLSSAGGL